MWVETSDGRKNPQIFTVLHDTAEMGLINIHVDYTYLPINIPEWYSQDGANMIACTADHGEMIRAPSTPHPIETDVWITYTSSDTVPEE